MYADHYCQTVMSFVLPNHLFGFVVNLTEKLYETETFEHCKKYDKIIACITDTRHAWRNSGRDFLIYLRQDKITILLYFSMIRI